MAAITYPIMWFMATLRLWRDRERQVLAQEMADDAATADVHHELNASAWYLPPPC